MPPHEPDVVVAGPALAITMFGPMQVLVRGEPLPPLRSRKSLWLLALLTLRHGRAVDRAWLAGTLWPDMEQSLCFVRLRVVLSELRHAFGDEGEHLQTPSRRTLLLASPRAEASINADVLTFDAAIASGTLPALERAISLYRGPLLEGCPEEWVGQERSDREQACLQALQTLAQAAQSAGNHDAAARYWQRGVGIDPLWDRAQRGWMESLAETGDTNAALQVYRDFVTRLKNDPQAIPDEKTTALYQRLRSEVRRRASPPDRIVTETTTRSPTVIGYLPHALTELVGREDERLEAVIQLRRSRLVTLTGVGGIGKTRLALKVAAEVVKEYPDGVWLVALDSLASGELVAGHVAGVLSVKETAGRTLLQSVTDHLRKKRLLLVLDNCEHLLEATSQIVSHLLKECAGVRVLTTSRESLGITGETVWAVPALAVPKLAHLPTGRATMQRVLMSYESIQLFVARAKSVHHTFSLTNANMLAVAQVCVQLEGVPLAIELAAARAKAMTAEQVAERLQEHLGAVGLLTGGSRTASSRQRTLRGALDWSFALLNEPEKTLFRRLSVFAGGWSLMAAEQVCAGSGIETDTVLDLLTSLVDKSLVVFTVQDDGTNGRYRLLEIVRQYASAQLQESGEGQSLRTRQRDWCVTFAKDMMSKEQFEVTLSSLENEHDNFRAALAWCASDPDGIETGLQLASLLWQFWSARGYLGEGGRHLRQSVERDGAQARTLIRAQALIGAGVLSGNHRTERVFIEESLSIYQELEDQEGIANSLNHLGNAESHMGNYALAESHYRDALRIFTDMGNKTRIAWSINNLGVSAYLLGDLERAKLLFEEGLHMRRELGGKHSIITSVNNLGSLACEQNDLLSAQQYLEESLSLSRELGDKEQIANTLNSLGKLACRQENVTSAYSFYQEALAISNEVSSSEIGTVSLTGLADVMQTRSKLREAVCLWGAILTIRESIGAALHPKDKDAFEQKSEAARLALGDDGFTQSWNKGRGLTWEQAVAYAQELSL